MSNPVLTRLEAGTRQGAATRPQPPAPSAAELDELYRRPSLQKAAPPAAQPGFPPGGFPPVGGGGGGWGGGGGGGNSARAMTLDDVVVRSVGLWAVLLVAAAVSWFASVDAPGLTAPLLVVGLMGGLGLGLFISFTGRANALTCGVYAAAQGLLLGAVSRAFDQISNGIVVQAISATLVVAGVTFAAYRISGFRVTPRFTRMVVIGTVSVFGLMLVNLVASLFVDGGLGIRSGGVFAVLFSLVCIVLAVSNLVLDFDGIQRAVAHGAPEKTAWLAAFGLMVTLIWLYIEILRLLGYARN